MLSLVFVVLAVTTLSDGRGLGKAPRLTQTSRRAVPTSLKSPVSGREPATVQRKSASLGHQTSLPQQPQQPQYTLLDIAKAPCGGLSCYEAAGVTNAGNVSLGMYGLPWMKKTILRGKWIKFQTKPYDPTLADHLYYEDLTKLLDATPPPMEFVVPSVIRFDPSPEAVEYFKRYRANMTIFEGINVNPNAKIFNQQQVQKKMEILEAAFLAVRKCSEAKYNTTLYNYVHPKFQVRDDINPRLNSTPTNSIVIANNAAIDSMLYYNAGLQNIFHSVFPFFGKLNKPLTTFYVANYVMTGFNEVWVCSNGAHPKCI